MREYHPSLGETWIDGNNQKFTVIKYINNPDRPLLAIDSKKRIQSFTREGFFIGKEWPSKSDLKEKV